MKHLLIGLGMAVLVLVALAMPVHAIGIHGMYWQVDDLDDSGLGLGVREPLRQFGAMSLEGRAAWVGFDGADIFPFEIALLGHVDTEKIVLYGGAMIGFFVVTGDADFKDPLGWSLLGGAAYGMGESSRLYMELGYTFLDSEFSTDVLPKTDIALDGFRLHAGIAFGKRN